MGSVALLVVFLLSLAPGVLGRIGGPAWSLDGIPWLPLALLPWLVVCGWPRGERREPTPVASIGLLLPALALALAADLEAGFAARALVVTAAWGIVLCASLALAAQRGRALHAALWWMLVPAAALLLAARGFVGDLPAGGWLTRVLAASPMAWPLLSVDGLRTAGGEAGVPLGPLAVAALLVLAGLRGESGEGEQVE